ncbi:hypothetical protein EsH8_IV_001248 [Colletotrichum jinshuiense]
MSVPSPPPPVRVVSEGRRERETFRYDSSLIAQAVRNDITSLIPFSELTSSADPALTAFAELGALRLNASRALISLFDSKFQYIVAEATPSTSLTPNDKLVDPVNGEHLTFCGTSIPRWASICEIVLAGPEPSCEQPTPDQPELPVTVICDLTNDPRSPDHHLCRQSPQNRFFAGVPIRSQKGINIGVFSIFGDKPREGLDDVSIRFMRDTSRIILDYLDAKRIRDDHRRADRMVRGVGSFVEGKSTVSGWRQRADPASFDEHLSYEGVLNKNQQQLQQESGQQAEKTPPLQEESTSPRQPNSPANRPSTPTDPLRRMSQNQSSTASVKSNQSDTGSTYEQSSDPHADQIKLVFSKASNIVREAIEVESVLFLDASIGSFGGLADSRPFQARSSNAGLSTSSSSGEEKGSLSGSVTERDDSDDAFCRVLGFSSSAASSIDGHSPFLSHCAVSEKLLTKLLRRYPEGKIFNFDENGSVQSSDFSGEDASSAETPAENVAEASSSTTQPRQINTPEKPRRRLRGRYSRRNEGKLLNTIFSGARSIAVVPLWDAQKQRWFAGGLICTKTPTRVLTIEGELSYLRAFGMVIMSEVNRLNSQLVDKAKTDLLSSLSHELRSPLHGIILGSELLHDTSLDAFQGETLVSIENCGRTLLETIDHLLDWSKINNFIGPSSRRRKSAAGVGDRGLRGRDRKISIQAGMMSITSNVEIDVLVEEVVESVSAGFSYQRVSLDQLANNKPVTNAETNVMRRLDGMQALEDAASESNRLGDLQLVLGDVAITFNITPAVSWAFHTQPGAIRRIIMNLLGNSLKYTSEGFVNVSVIQSTPKDGSVANNTTLVDIIVTDSGRGISEEYLRYHLFSPFSQENSLSAGAGLGLSLVNQIVAKLGGTIQVWSKIGQGTKVTVRLPLQPAIPVSPNNRLPPSYASFNEFEASVSELGGLRVKLLGFPTDYGVQRVEDLTGSTIPEGTLIGNVCREWLQMQIVDESDADQLLPDMILSTERHLDRLLYERRNGIISTPVVVICRNALIARRLATSPRFTGKKVIFEFISQPIGPRKLAKVLLLSFRRWTKSQAGAIPTPTAMSLASVAASSTNGNTPTGPELMKSAGESNETLPELPAEDELSLKPTPTEDQTPEDPQTEDADSGNVVLADRRKETSTPVLNGTASTREPKQASSPKFLLVDDNPLNLKILASYMQKLGHKYHNAMDGRQAIEVFQQGAGEFQCILMDISMPVMDGFEATRRIRALEAERGLSRCHVFALTGLASASAQQEAFASGIDLFLTKPVRLKELNKILEMNGIA